MMARGKSSRFLFHHEIIHWFSRIIIIHNNMILHLHQSHNFLIWYEIQVFFWLHVLKIQGIDQNWLLLLLKWYIHILQLRVNKNQNCHLSVFIFFEKESLNPIHIPPTRSDFSPSMKIHSDLATWGFFFCQIRVTCFWAYLTDITPLLRILAQKRKSHRISIMV